MQSFKMIALQRYFNLAEIKIKKCEEEFLFDGYCMVSGVLNNRNFQFITEL